MERVKAAPTKVMSEAPYEVPERREGYECNGGTNVTNEMDGNQV